MTEPKINLREATRKELVAEVQRLREVNQRWSDSWQTVVEANRVAWTDQVMVLWRAASAMGALLNNMPDSITRVPVTMENMAFSEAFVNAHVAFADLPTMFREAPPDQ